MVSPRDILLTLYLLLDLILLVWLKNKRQRERETFPDKSSLVDFEEVSEMNALLWEGGPAELSPN